MRRSSRSELTWLELALAAAATVILLAAAALPFWLILAHMILTRKR